MSTATASCRGPDFGSDGNCVAQTSCSGGCDPCCQTVERSSRLDLLVGYRYVQLREGISIREDLTSLLSAPEQGSFDIVDQFGTTNSFHGADLGVTWRARCGPWLVDILGKLALGGVQQTVAIDGQTVISGSLNDNGTYVGGLLAQRTNIGQHRRNVFAMIPELGVNLGYQLTPCLSAKIGYNFLYWSRVVRPGDEIDLDVNPDLLPPETEFAGAARPASSGATRITGRKGSASGWKGFGDLTASRTGRLVERRANRISSALSFANPGSGTCRHAAR